MNNKDIYPWPTVFEPDQDEGGDLHHYKRRRHPIQSGIQYTSEYRSGDVGGAEEIQDATVLSQTFVPGQDPNSIQYIPKIDWDIAWWNKVPIVAQNLTPEEMAAFLFPSPDTMRGLNQYFYEINPFADYTAPTVAEIDYWNIHVIKHLRNIFGNNNPIEPDHCLFLRAQWGLERKWSSFWDEGYGYTGLGSDEGPCWLFGELFPDAPNCGENFIPDHALDQDIYGLGVICTNEPAITTHATIPPEIPWSIKLSKIIYGHVQEYIASGGSDGTIITFHTAAKVGFGFHGSNFIAKWTG